MIQRPRCGRQPLRGEQPIFASWRCRVTVSLAQAGVLFLQQCRHTSIFRKTGGTSGIKLQFDNPVAERPATTPISEPRRNTQASVHSTTLRFRAKGQQTDMIRRQEDTLDPPASLLWLSPKDLRSNTTPYASTVATAPLTFSSTLRACSIPHGQRTACCCCGSRRCWLGRRCWWQNHRAPVSGTCQLQ